MIKYKVRYTVKGSPVEVGPMTWDRALEQRAMVHACSGKDVDVTFFEVEEPDAPPPPCRRTDPSPQVAPFGEPLSPEVTEILTILAEECGEVVQRVTKILRFGFRRNPWDDKDNVERLEQELGDVAALVECLHHLDVIDTSRVVDNAVKKLKAFLVEEDPTRPRLRHASEPLKSAGLEGRVKELTGDWIRW